MSLDITDTLVDFLRQWGEMSPAAVVVLTLVFVFGGLTPIPRTFLTLAAGIVYGIASRYRHRRLRELTPTSKCHYDDVHAHDRLSVDGVSRTDSATVSTDPVLAPGKNVAVDHQTQFQLNACVHVLHTTVSV